MWSVAASFENVDHSTSDQNVTTIHQGYQESWKSSPTVPDPIGERSKNSAPLAVKRPIKQLVWTGSSLSSDLSETESLDSHNKESSPWAEFVNIHGRRLTFSGSALIVVVNTWIWRLTVMTP
mmetsp:Transcript_2430/g.3909  ORF Transcript_2430/g.3909 Transcript_2430/m.3909 type:complete len:122 (-) Transcript_2430:2008-2373(-)